MQGLQVDFRSVGGHRVVVVSGEIDIATAAELRAALLEAARSPSKGLIVDMAAVTFMDARGLGVLAEIHRQTRHLRHGLRLAAPGPQIIRLLATTGLADHLPNYPSVDEAAHADPVHPVA